MRVKDIMHSIMRVPHDLTVAEIAIAMSKKPTGSVLLEEGGKPMGIITERDILRKVVAQKKNPNQVKGYEIASYPLITIDAEMPVEEAGVKMYQHNIRRILISENGNIVGKLTAGAILKNMKYVRMNKMLSQERAYERAYQ
jgi:signal-transduction protein with cAMP-binding, CBS, and nucleotidyltransferase domain